jgi:hypothetical protein
MKRDEVGVRAHRRRDRTSVRSTAKGRRSRRRPAPRGAFHLDRQRVGQAPRSARLSAAVATKRSPLHDRPWCTRGADAEVASALADGRAARQQRAPQRPGVAQRASASKRRGR